MKTTPPRDTGLKQTGPNRNATNPKKPGNDPDQTPEREVENIPVAKPGTSTPQKNKIGFKK